MRRFFNFLLAAIRTSDRNERNFWLGLSLLFIGLTWMKSVFLALIVVGAVMAVESVITSYIAAVINTRDTKDLQQ